MLNAKVFYLRNETIGIFAVTIRLEPSNKNPESAGSVMLHYICRIKFVQLNDNSIVTRG